MSRTTKVEIQASAKRMYLKAKRVNTKVNSKDMHHTEALLELSATVSMLSYLLGETLKLVEDK